MKNHFLILAALCGLLCGGCGGESKTKIPSDPTEAFPDPIFRAYVLENFDTDGDGKISEDEALAVTEIHVGKNNIKSLDGIQYFTNLIYLRCTANRIASLDVSKNTELTYLYCGANQLTTLDVSNNTELTELSCNSNQLTTLDVSKNTMLTELGCWSNQLTTLDVSKNTKLERLWCDDNKIAELDLSKTNFVNSKYNDDSSSYHPLDCSPMNTLKKVYLKKGWSILGITEDWNRSSDYIPNHTEIIFVD